MAIQRVISATAAVASNRAPSMFRVASKYAPSLHRVASTRAFSATTAPTLWPLVDRLNKTVEQYPASSFATHTGGSLAFFGAGSVALWACGFDAPSLAVAGVVTRLTKKLRTPFELTLAAALAHTFPAANTLKLGPLLAAPLSAASAVPPEELSRFEKGMIRAADAVQGPVNTYGGPYIVVNWVVGLSSVAAATAAVHAGLDVHAALLSLPLVGSTVSAGFLSAASGGASCVAGAMLLNTLALPLRLYCLSLYGARAFGAVEAAHAASLVRYRSWLRRTLREDPTAPRRLAVRAAPPLTG